MCSRYVSTTPLEAMSTHLITQVLRKDCGMYYQRATALSADRAPDAGAHVFWTRYTAVVDRSAENWMASVVAGLAAVDDDQAP